MCYICDYSGGYSISPYIDAEWEKTMKEHLRQEGQEATAYVENAGRAANVEVESIILEGSPAVEIIDFAEKNDIDLIVMGSHGKSAIQRFLIGSVAEKVIKHSKIAVLVVRKETAENVLLNLIKYYKTRCYKNETKVMILDMVDYGWL